MEAVMHRQRNFGLLMMLVVAASAPASGQTAGPAVAPAAIPDFSGIWSHPSFPGFEPLASGPTSLRNRSRMAPHSCLPPLSPCPQGRGNFFQLVGDYTSAILKPQAVEIVKKLG